MDYIGIKPVNPARPVMILIAKSVLALELVNATSVFQKRIQPLKIPVAFAELGKLLRLLFE